MRLGGPIFAKTDTPEAWAAAVAAAGYRAAYCPVTLDADHNTIQAYATAAQKADIVIAEVGHGAIRSAPTRQRLRRR